MLSVKHEIVGMRSGLLQFTVSSQPFSEFTTFPVFEFGREHGHSLTMNRVFREPRPLLD